jgi:hypothetical protein
MAADKRTKSTETKFETESTMTEYEHKRAELQLLTEHLRNVTEAGDTAPEAEWQRARELMKWLKEHTPTESEPHIEAVETDDLSPETRSEVESVAVLSGLSEDRAVLKDMRDEWNALYEARVVAMSDVADLDGRNEKIDQLEQRMRELRDEMAVLEAVVAIAELDTTDEGQPT